MKDHTLSEVDATTWFKGDESVGQPEVMWTENNGGKPTLSKKMMEDCRTLLIASGVLPPTEGEARDVASYLAPLTALVD